MHWNYVLSPKYRDSSGICKMLSHLGFSQIYLRFSFLFSYTQSLRPVIWDHHLRCLCVPKKNLGLYSLIGRWSYRKISWSLEATRSDVIVIISFWSEIWEASRLIPSNAGSRGFDFETSRDLAVRRPSAKWIEALQQVHYQVGSIFTQYKRSLHYS